MYSSLMLPLDGLVEFDPSQRRRFFCGRSRASRHFAGRDARPRAPVRIWSAPLTSAVPLERLLGSARPGSKRLNLREVAARIRYRVTGSKFEQTLALYQHARATFPGPLPRSRCACARLRC